MGDSERGAFTARVLSGIGEVPAAAWDACAGDGNPFVSHAFLSALEESGSATAETGWAPRHVVIEDADGRDADGRVVGAAPMYLKSHSYGEYVFDHGWADAFERAGGRYYPKLQVAVPFTPVSGPRLLARPGPRAAGVRRALAAALADVTRRSDASSLHVTFCTEAEWRLLGDLGFLLRSDRQFHWTNDGYASFDDFLGALSARKRKTIRRERRDALANGITIETLTGNDIKSEHWDAFFTFYTATSDRKWGFPYLTRDFFDRLGAGLGGRVVLIMARREGRLIAGALNVIGRDALYGRNWGTIEHHPFLHFELCYYRAIDFAIERGLGRVEAGAQGPHKIARGYLPVHTYSAHWIRHAALRDAVAHFLARERPAVDAEVEFLADHAPFRKG
ncbi:MAG: N-acetyltransferase [Proteobacteria bacterium]|nr:N-acetyltransferase [Pseudomonadota bacterium]